MTADAQTLDFLVQHMGRTEADRLGHVIVEFATLSLLVDAKLTTVEEAAQRIELIQSVLPEPYRADDVTERVKLATAWLRSFVKQPRGQWRPVVIEGGLGQDAIDDPTLSNS